MMKKNSTKGYVILGIIFVLVNAIAFAVPTMKTPTFWIAYAFTAAAFAAQLIIWKPALSREEMLKSKFLGFPVVHIGIVYAVIQTVAFAVFLFAPTLPTWSAIVVCSIIVGVSAVCMISADAGRDEIERVETKVQKKVFYIRELQADVELMASAETDADIKAALTQLAERIRFSDPMSSDLLTEIETMIESRVKELKTAENKLAIISATIALITERNKKAKILK